VVIVVVVVSAAASTIRHSYDIFVFVNIGHGPKKFPHFFLEPSLLVYKLLFFFFCFYEPVTSLIVCSMLPSVIPVTVLAVCLSSDIL